MIRIKNEEIESIYLLSIQQAERLPRYILAIGDSWWLRTPGTFCGTAEVDENSNVNYFGLKVDYNWCGVRPALTVKNLDSLNYEIGETVKVLGLTAQYIGDNSVLLCESIAKHRFDSKSNDYETSEIKQFIEEWLETKKNEGKHKMTREEAREALTHCIDWAEHCDDTYVDCVPVEVLRIALEALKKSEPITLTLEEKCIFLSVIGREKYYCQKTDEFYKNSEIEVKPLVPVVDEIKRKVMTVLWREEE